MIIYGSFIGVIEYDEDEKCYIGHVTNMETATGRAKDGITYSGKTEDEATKDFEKAVDDYLEWGKEEGWLC